MYVLETMKYISEVQVNMKKYPSDTPKTDIIYGCLIATNNSQEIDIELEQATARAQSVTWILDRQASTWRGAVYGPDPIQIERVRTYLIEKSGWRQMDLSHFEDSSAE